jgi:hypothetical protein
MSPPSYHLWLKPSGSAYALFAETIGDLAHELNASVFEPHVTLLGRLTGNEQLARQLHPFQVIVTEASYRSEYFQCLFLRVARTPAIINANTLARRVFCREEEAYMPHLSLAYGLYPEPRKREVIANLRPDVRTCFEVSAVYLIKANSPDPKDWREILVRPMGE